MWLHNVGRIKSAGSELLSLCHHPLQFPVPLLIRSRFKPKTQREPYPQLLRIAIGSRGRPRQAGWLAGRLSARLASIRFCLSVNNMASCVCVVVLTTAPDRAPSPPPRPFTAAPATSLCSACGLHYAAFAHFNSHPEWRQQSERCSQRTSRRRNGGVKSVMCRLGKIVLGFAALILPSLKCSRRSRNQSAKSADQRREV